MDEREVMTEVRLVREEIGQVRDEVRHMREEMERTRGFVGGVLWCASGVAAMGGFVWGMVTGG